MRLRSPVVLGLGMVAAVAAVLGLTGLLGPSATDATESSTGTLTVLSNPAGDPMRLSVELRPLTGAAPPSTSTAGPQPVTFAGLVAGRYLVDVSSPSPQVDVADVSCEPASTVLSMGTDSTVAVLSLADGQAVSCVASGQRRGHITLQTIPEPLVDVAPVTLTPGWSSAFDQAGGQMHRSPALKPGTHDVGTDAIRGWDVTQAVCDDGSALDAVDLGPGENILCTVQVAQRGAIEIDVVTEPERSRLFRVETSWGRVLRVGGDDTRTSRPLRPGSYTLEARLPEGWDEKSFRCEGGASASDISLAAGERLRCTLVAVKRGSIAVALETNPTGATPDVELDPTWGRAFTLVDDGRRVSRPLRPADHSIDVTTPRGWDVSGSRCSGGNSLAAITLGAGRSVECTVVVTKRGRITVQAAAATPGSATFDVVPSWGAAFSVGDGESVTSRRLKPGTHSITTDAPRGWSRQSASCSDGSSPDAIDLDPGEDVVCTVTFGRAQFTVATFNVLGASHTDRGGYAARLASGATRMGWTVDLIRRRGVDVIGMQEVQPSQAQAFLRGTSGEFAMYPGPGSSLGYKQNVVAWRTGMFDLVEALPNYTPYLNGNRVPMPVVKLRHKASGQEVYVISVHNAASIARTGNNDRWRAAAMRQQVDLTARLLRTGTPVIMTGDMNSRTPYFCQYTRTGQMRAAAGGSSGGACQPPPASLAGIDWIFGSSDIGFSGYAKVKTGIVGRISDHPFVVTEAVLNR